MKWKYQCYDMKAERKSRNKLKMKIWQWKLPQYENQRSAGYSASEKYVKPEENSLETWRWRWLKIIGCENKLREMHGWRNIGCMKSISKKQHKCENISSTEMTGQAASAMASCPQYIWLACGSSGWQCLPTAWNASSWRSYLGWPTYNT